eukprot:gene4311-4564_t
MSKKAAGENIRTTIRIRPCSAKEKETYPGPSLVQAADGEVRMYQRPASPTATSGSSSQQASRSNSPAAGLKHHRTANGADSFTSGGPSPVHKLKAAAVQQLGSDFQAYPFARVFGPEADNEQVYKGSGCQDVVQSILGGCNGTILVYGQTGAGKTYTMDAFTQLVLQQLFSAAASKSDAGCEVSISISAVELYNEALRCLLCGRDDVQMRMVTNGVGAAAAAATGLVLEGAEERVCSSIEEAMALITEAQGNRAVGETRANARSSRSHLVVRIRVEMLLFATPLAIITPAQGAQGAQGTATPACVTFSMESLTAASGGHDGHQGVEKLNLVDLAGSERVDKSGSSDTPLRLKEALNINKSLLCLGNVVNALADRGETRKSHIPYRDSKLTRLLEDSLGGNALTALVACITPLPDWHMEQTRATLDFAARAARVMCRPQKNLLKLPQDEASGSAALVATLQAEVAALRAQLVQQQQQHHQKSCNGAEAHAADDTACHSPTDKGTDGFGIMLGSSSSGSGGFGGIGGGRHSRSSSLNLSALKATHSLRSTGLLMTTSAKPCSSPGCNSPHSSTLTGDSSRQGLLDRLTAGNARRCSSHHSPQSSLGDFGYADALLLPNSSPAASATSTLRRMTQRSLDGGSGAASPGRTSRAGTSSGCAAGDGALAGDAGGGFALRDYIIRQLSAALQQKKSEIKVLKQQLAGVQAQLQGAQGEGTASKQKLQELAEAIQALAATRQEEFEHWKGHLAGVDQALQSAKQESHAYRQEALSLVQQLTQLQARYRSLQTDSLRRNSLMRSSSNSAAQLAAALKQLQEALPVIKAAAVGAAGGPPAAIPAVPGPLAPLLGQLSPLTAPELHCKPDSCPWPLPEQLPVSQAEGLLQQQPMGLIAPGVTPAAQLGVSAPGGTSLHGWAMHGTTAAAAAAGMSSCRKCDSMKSLLALLQKLKDEVVMLKAAVAFRDAKLSAEADASASMKREAEKFRCQVDVLQERVHNLILLSWKVLCLPCSYRTAFVLGDSCSRVSSSNDGATQTGFGSLPPWLDREQCQAHVALLACLHQLHEDDPAVAAAQKDLLAEEVALMDTGLATLGVEEQALLAQRWHLPLGGDWAANRSLLLQKMWSPCGASGADDDQAAAAAASSQMALSMAPAQQLVLLNTRLGAHLIAAASRAVADSN